MAINYNIRPYLIINGKRSDSILGLLITALAPVSKPQILTQVETVNGRDGDIVTPLGYGAYDKTISIALTYEYNIDDIIEFFNSEGKVVFSNEPDKYYKFAIYQRIDFERLIRFRTADVTFHVQPFKYSDEESVKTFTDREFKIVNQGNIYSRPTISITGFGTITLFINTKQILKIELGNLPRTIIIDGSEMNAYSEDGAFLNRIVTGDYDKMILSSGNNKIEITGGDISRVSIDHYSRWI